MKIGEWDTLGRSRQLLQRQIAEMGATEYATHVTVNQDTGRLRIFVASDLGLMDYQYAPVSANRDAAWILRGQLHRWATIRNLRLQTDAQLEEGSDAVKSVWRLVAEDPKIELSATSDQGEREIEALLALARACLRQSA